MIRSFLLLVAVLVAATPVDAAKRRSRNIVYRPVPRTVSTATTRTVTTRAATTTTSTPRPGIATASAKPAPANTIAKKFKGTPLQDWADAEAKMMVERRFKGHVRSAPMGTFVGVGFSMSGRVVTCVGGGQLVAQTTLRGPDGFYHVRVWR